MAILFKIFRNGNPFSCTVDGGAKFFVGKRVPYEDYIGFYNIFSGSKLQRLNYSADEFAGAHGFWAGFIEPTSRCEGRNFLTLNTYDRAAFTFGFGQFAAHVPNGDFVEYLRAMLRLPNASDYFPHLALANGRIVRTDGPGTPVILETDDSTAKLMAYLNPDLSEVQDAEVIAAAKLIHWTSNSVAARDCQVSQMVSTFASFMKRADKRVGIHGRPAAQCAVIADILHHGRGGKMTWPLIGEALASSKPYDALLKIGLPRWAGRLTTLRNAIGDRPEFAARHWDRATGAFV